MKRRLWLVALVLAFFVPVFTGIFSDFSFYQRIGWLIILALLSYIYNRSFAFEKDEKFLEELEKIRKESRSERE